MSPKEQEGLLIKETTRSYLKDLVYVTGIICGLISAGYTFVLLPKMKDEIKLESGPLKNEIMFLKILNLVKSTPEEIKEAERRMKYYKHDKGGSK